MANLNIPFLLLQPSLCQFEPSLETSKLIPYANYNFKPLPSLRQPNGLRDRPGSGNMLHSLMRPGSGMQVGYDQSQQTHQFGKYSPFDDTPKNLVVLGDSKSGTLVLCHEEHYLSTSRKHEHQVSEDTHNNMTTQKSKEKQVSKFIVSLIPRVALIPSISQETGPVLDYAIVRSPAPNILSTSQFFLVTLHDDNIIRLWNTNDGRCVLSSQKEMFVTKAIAIKKIKGHPGNIIVIGQNKDIYVVNVYKMIVFKHFQFEFEGCVECVFKDKYFIIVDKKGKVFVWKDDSEPSPIKTSNVSIMLEATNQDDYETFSFSLDSVIGEEENEQGNKVLAFEYFNQDQIFVVSSYRIDIYISKTRRTLYSFNRPSMKLIFARFLEVEERGLLLVIDEQMNAFIYDQTKLKHAALSHEHMDKSEHALMQLNLLQNCKYFEPYAVKTEGQIGSLLNDHNSQKQKQFNDVQNALKQLVINNKICFKYSNHENVLYSIIKSECGHSQMISWSMSTIVDNLNTVSHISEYTKIPMFINKINLFPSASSNPQSLINFQPLIVKSFYNKNQFQFFFSDEKVTDSVVYTSSDHPALIIGTNYGRIFMTPMFQESDEKIYPIVLIDSHHQSPITNLFVAYNSARKSRFSKSVSYSQQQIQQLSTENGGHLISVSEDGTIAVTNLNSGEIHRAIHNYTIKDSEKTRADKFFQERSENSQQKRRNSITQYFSVNQFYQMVKVKSQRTFNYTTFGTISKILDVKDLHQIQSKLIQKSSSTRKSTITPDRRTEETDQTKRSNSFSGAASPDDFGFTSTPTYACVSSDGVVFLLTITSLHVEMTKLCGLDSEAIGIYTDDVLGQYFILTNNLNFYIFNKRSNILERRADFRYAMNILMIKETVEYLISKNEGFRIAAKGDQNIFEFEIFEKIFKKKSLLIGLGSHKILDYLSLSLNLPMQYHPHSTYSTKFTKSMYDLLDQRQYLADFGKREESQKHILRAINDSFFLNNKLYKSDFNEDFFYKQSGVTCLQTQESVFRSKQQILIASSKQMLLIMQHRMTKIKNQKTRAGPNHHKQKSQQNLGNLEDIKITEDGAAQGDADFFMKEEVKEPMQLYPPVLGKQNNIVSIQGNKRNSINEGKHNQETLSSNKWPTRLLSLIHPFNIDIGVDEAMENFFGLNLPFLDFRLGIQGAGESFSFIISKEDEDYHSERNNVTKILRLLKLSTYKKEQLEKLSKLDKNLISQHQEDKINSLEDLNNQIAQIIEQEPAVRFFGSEYWKISSYLSTIIPTFFLSMLVSIVEHSQQDVTFLIQEWIDILQRINQQKTIHNSNGISLSVVSKILLKKEHNIAATGRDIILKPLLYNLDKDSLKILIDEWTTLILDTYRKLKKESSVRQAYGAGGSHNHHPNHQAQAQNQSQSASSQSQQMGDRKLINQYFGELEIRGLINISYFSLYFHDQLDNNIQYRVSKLTTILTREIVDKFNHNKKYIHLLTLLLQLLSTWMKSQSNTFNNKAIINEVIKLLLFIYNINKSPLNRESVITRVTGINFHLIRPTHSELYLKLTAAKALLEIGENFTHDFLMMIQEEATHLQQGPEYQQNVLEVLKFFINGYGENLEQHLIQITQILLKCLDPNELALRKNSHKIISVILSIMVKMFPMVSFHHESQRLAVGTHDGPIAIYDVRTSAKWKILEGHTGNVTCLTFDSRGNLLASYSAVDMTLRLWKVGNTGFFSTIMGGTGKCSNQINLRQLAVRNPHAALQAKKQQSIQQQELNNNNNILDEAAQNANQAQGGKRVNKCSVKFLMPKEKEVELVREDGLKERHKLVK